MTHTIATAVKFAACAAMFLSPALLAQGDAAAKPTPDYCSMDKVIGAKVRMSPGAESRREAAKDGETAKRPEGKIDDLLVDCCDGSLKYAVISFGGFLGINDKTVAVPCSALTWIPANEVFEIAASEDRLRALPAFDLSKARKAGLDGSAETIVTHWNTASKAEANATKGEVVREGEKIEPKGEVKEASVAKLEAKPIAGTPFHTMPVHLVCVSEIDDYNVYAGPEKFGSVSDLLVDRNKRSLDLLVVKHGGTQYLLPLRVVHYCSSGDERVHCVRGDIRTLETAVVYEKPKHGIVEPDAAKRALENKTFDKDKDGKSDSNNGG